MTSASDVGPDVDVIVVGLGAWGSSAAFHLARRGHRVVGIDRFEPPHAYGSSHGGSRVFLGVNLGPPPYHELMRRARALWRHIETESGEELIQEAGAVHVGPAGSELIGDVLAAYERDRVPHEVLDWRALRADVPVLRLLSGEVGVRDRSTWVLRPERAVAAHLRLARQHGASLLCGEPVLGWQATSDGVTVTTPVRRLRARHVVLTVGAWSGDPSGGGLPVVAERQVSAWFQPREGVTGFGLGALPVFVVGRTQAGRFYGVPSIGAEGVKVAFHHGGLRGHPDDLDRAVHPVDIEPLRSAVRERFPGLKGRPHRVEMCIYPDSPDLHPIIGRLPSLPEVIVASGGSGHGFRLSTVVGEAVADLVEGRSRWDLSTFTLGRSALVHPAG